VSEAVVTAILSSAVLLSVPVIWAALGEAISEQAGTLNIGIEGVMLFGAFTAAIGIRTTGSLLVGLALALPTGLVLGALLSYLYVYRATDQILTGIMLNILALGLTTVIYDSAFTGIGGETTFGNLAIPGLSRIPVVGPAFFDQNVLVYAAGAFSLVVFFLLRRTWFGLNLRVIGERPGVGERAGLDVRLLRTCALLVSCCFVAVGGASLVLMITGDFGINMTAGQGYVALAVVIFARWNPIVILGAAFVFGLANAVQLQAQSLSFGGALPHDIWSLLPYVVVVVAVALGGRGVRYPAACGVPYRPRTSARPHTA
jgi:simple sugar transport system permease protein